MMGPTLLFGLFLGLAEAADPCPGLWIAAAPSAGSPDLRGQKVTLEAGPAAAAALPLWVRASGEAPCEARLYLSAPRESGLAATLSEAQLALTPGQAPKEMTISIDGATRQGRWPVLLSAWAGGEAADLLTVEVLAEVPTAPVLSALEAEQGALSWSTLSAAVDHRLTLLETGEKVGAKLTVLPLTLRAGDLETTLVAAPSALELAAGGSAEIRLQGSLPSVGTWKGRLTLEHAAGRQSLQVTVERKSAESAPALVALAEPTAGWPLDRRVGAEVRVAEPGKRPVTLTGLRLTRLLPPGAKAEGSATALAEPCWRRDGQGECAPAGASPEAPVALPAGGDAVWRLDLDTPRRAGTYTGTVELRTLEGDAVPAATFSVDVRHHWALCLLTVGLGVGLSWWMRGWVTVGRAAAARALAEAKAKEQEGEVEMGGEAAAAPPDLAGFLGKVEVPFELPEYVARPPAGADARALARWIRRRELLFALVIFTLAGLFAVYELWSKSPTWGGLGDYLLALGWGAGLHLAGRRAAGGQG